jgi:hypothetical protein
MRKLMVTLALLTVFAYNSIVYAPPPTRVVVYKGTIKASNSIFDVNDPAKLYSGTVKGYWAMRVINEGTLKGAVVDSNAVLYDTKEKYYKVIPHAIIADPCDPCGVVMFNFMPTDAEGQISFYAVGTGRLAKLSNDTAVAKDYATMAPKGTGLLFNYDFFDPNYTFSGPISVTMTLDSALTRAANPDLFTVDDIINSIVDTITSRGEWTKWDYVPGGLQ